MLLDLTQCLIWTDQSRKKGIFKLFGTSRLGVWRAAGNGTL